ncbi:MAG: hydrolase [Myxococcales bacterium]|nr:hydrolase [Myxococcales bacterium]
MQPSQSFQTVVHAGRVALIGDLSLPPHPDGIIVFAHGSGSGRLSPRNRYVADRLVDANFATLLFDLLTREEEVAERYTRHLRFDIPMLAERLIGALHWIHRQDRIGGLPIGLFGASTGAAAALIAATRVDVGAVVSRGGRPDLAAEALPQVRCPTLFIVGGDDPEVLQLNRRAAMQMTAEVQIYVVEGATHLFEERGALDEVTEVATGWFRAHLVERVERAPAGDLSSPH